MIIYAIDGASRRNGKPDCLATGSIFIRDTELGSCMLRVGHEKGSTSQRGEINALLGALQVGMDIGGDVFLVTDSEYVWNSVSKAWYKNWRNKGWITGVGEPVKNKDLWEDAGGRLDFLEMRDQEVIAYHVKGHLLSLGKKTTEMILDKDKTGKMLYDRVAQCWDDFQVKRSNTPDTLDEALDKFQLNHGFMPTLEVYKELILCNTVADLAAGYYADIADAEWKR